MPLTIGQQLQTARIDRNLSLKDVFENTHIRIKYLEALEADDFSAMPSPVQGRGFLRLYAQYLGLDANTMLAELKRQEQTEASFSKSEATLDETPPEAGSTTAEKPTADERTESAPPLWRQFLARFGVTLASSVPDSVQEQDAAPIAEPSPKSAPEAPPERPVKPMTQAVSPSPSPQPTGESDSIFAEIGATLRERREMLSLTYAEIEGHIHLRPHYMEALEAGNFGSLPSPVQTRGMLTNYAEFLDLDVEAILLRFAEGLQAQRIERNAPLAGGARKPKKQFSLGGFIAPDLLFGVGVIVTMVAFSVWGLRRIANTRAEEVQAQATAPSIAEVLISTPTQEILLTPTETLVVVNTPDANAGTEIPPNEGEELAEGANLGVQILVTVLERSWMRVTVDGEKVFEGRAQPDATFVYEGTESVEVLTANGAGVRIAYNQQDMGLLGGFGEVVQRIYGPFGLLTPTVTPTLPATATPQPTQTLTPTLTQTVTATPTP